MSVLDIVLVDLGGERGMAAEMGKRSACDMGAGTHVTPRSTKPGRNLGWSGGAAEEPAC